MEMREDVVRFSVGIVRDFRKFYANWQSAYSTLDVIKNFIGMGTARREVMSYRECLEVLLIAIEMELKETLPEPDNSDSEDEEDE